MATARTRDDEGDARDDGDDDDNSEWNYLVIPPASNTDNFEPTIVNYLMQKGVPVIKPLMKRGVTPMQIFQVGDELTDWMGCVGSP